jgi:hypothetical protein
MYAIENGTFGYEQVTRFNLQDGRHTTAVEVWAAPVILGALGRRDRAMSLPAWLLRSRLDQLANRAPDDQGAPVAFTELDASGGYFTELR